MPEYTPKQYREIYDQLPQDLKEAIFSVTTADLMARIQQVFNLSDKQMRILRGEAGDVLMGITHPDDFGKIIAQKMEIDKELAGKLARQINRDIFFPHRESIRKIYHKFLPKEGPKEIEKKVEEVEEPEPEKEAAPEVPPTPTPPPIPARKITPTPKPRPGFLPKTPVKPLADIPRPFEETKEFKPKEEGVVSEVELGGEKVAPTRETAPEEIERKVVEYDLKEKPGIPFGKAAPSGPPPRPEVVELWEKIPRSKEEVEKESGPKVEGNVVDLR